jgi:glutamate synthase domain-containing protein 1
MCGIVGLFLKDQRLEPELGALFGPMLVAMQERGPDSAGFAVYRNPVPDGSLKLTLHHPDEAFAWEEIVEGLGAHLGNVVEFDVLATHAVCVLDGSEAAAREWLSANHPGVRITSAGRSIEIFKEEGPPAEFVERFAVRSISGSHAIGHTRMATESAVTTEHSHPFSTGLDLCLVHNGSLSNHNRLRAGLRQVGVVFETDNDSEVAAGYLTQRMRTGASLDQALESSLRDLDGFFTFAVGTHDGFAVLRDGIACKPAVLAETDQWVGMASEYRSLAHLPNAEDARIWEPAPATIYSWHRN